MEDRELSDIQIQAVDVKVLGAAKVIEDQNEFGMAAKVIEDQNEFGMEDKLMEDQSQTEQEPSKVPEEMICDKAMVESAATQIGN